MEEIIILVIKGGRLEIKQIFVSGFLLRGKGQLFFRICHAFFYIVSRLLARLVIKRSLVIDQKSFV